MKFTKFLALALVFIMALTALIACKEPDEPAETSGNADTTAPGSNGVTDPIHTGPETDEKGYEVDDLPDRVFDDQFHLFSWSNQLYWEFSATEETGDAINDTVLKRKDYLEKTYGIEVIVDSTPGEWGNRDAFVKTVEANQSETGDNAWDAVGCYFAVSGAMTVKGFFEDLNNKEYAPYINLDKPWWPDDLLHSASINGSVYAVTGDITPTFIRNLSVCHVNADLFEQYNTGVDLYELVENKEWTYEKLVELSLGKVVTEGTNKQYAITMDNNVVYDDLFYSTGMTMVDNLEDGSIALHDMETDEKFLDFYSFAYKLLNENDDVALLTMQSTGGFKEGQSMFHLGNAAQIQNYLQNVDWEYIALPMPMYKTSVHTTQDTYHSVQGFWTTLYSIPVNCSDYEIASFALEALASYGYRHLTPVWFNETFQNRLLQTPENAQMFTIIRDGVIFDTARIFGTHINCFGAFRQAASRADWVSYYKSNQKSWTLAIGQINQSLGN